MKSNAKPSPEYQNFENVARHVFRISKAELQRRIEADKQAKASRSKRGPKPRISASLHASADKG